MLAILNIIIEGSVLLMQEMGNIESRGLVLSAIGAGIIFFAFFSIPVRRWWAMVVNGGALFTRSAWFCTWYLCGSG